MPLDPVSKEVVDDRRLGVILFQQLVELPEFSSSSDEVPSVVRVDVGWTASAGHEPFQTLNECLGGGICDGLQVDCLCGKTDKNTFH